MMRTTRHGKRRPRKLRDLVLEHLDRKIQEGEHGSVEDATAAMDLYKLFAADWPEVLTAVAEKINAAESENQGRIAPEDLSNLNFSSRKVLEKGFLYIWTPKRFIARVNPDGFQSNEFRRCGNTQNIGVANQAQYGG